MGERICIKAGCHQPARSRKMCMRHYNIAKRGNELAPIQLELPMSIHSISHANVSTMQAHCSICGTVAVTTRADGSYRCGTKRKADSIAWWTPVRWRKARLSRYGLTVQQYVDMLTEQGGLCAICRQESDKVLCVDHDHATGVVRGILCRECNLALGNLKDDPVVVTAAAAYLVRHKPARLAQDGAPERIEA